MLQPENSPNNQLPLWLRIPFYLLMTLGSLIGSFRLGNEYKLDLVISLSEFDFQIHPVGEKECPPPPSPDEVIGNSKPQNVLPIVFSDNDDSASAVKWLRNHEKLFSLKDREVVNEIQNSRLSDDVAADLLNMSQNFDGPWGSLKFVIKVTVPHEDDQPGVGFAHCATNDDLNGKTLLLYRAQDADKPHIIVHCSDRIGAITSSSNLHLKQEDYDELFRNAQHHDGHCSAIEIKSLSN